MQALNESCEYFLTADVGVSSKSLNNGVVREFSQCFHVSARREGTKDLVVSIMLTQSGVAAFLRILIMLPSTTNLFNIYIYIYIYMNKFRVCGKTINKRSVAANEVTSILFETIFNEYTFAPSFSSRYMENFTTKQTR